MMLSIWLLLYMMIFADNYILGIVGTWQQIGSDIDGEASRDYSGMSVSLNSNGTIVAIGSHENDGAGIDAGHVRVYKYNVNIWQQIGSDIDGKAAYDYSGRSVSLNSDGTMVAIGATNQRIGHVRVYKYNVNMWQQIGSDIDEKAADDYPATYVSLNSDGTIVAIGAYGNDNAGNNAGHVRCFTINPTPAYNPTSAPTKNPTNPSSNPTDIPTKNPTNYPSTNPSSNPTDIPTTKSPTTNPSISPTNNPSIIPTKTPSKSPTKYPTQYPSISPSNNPSESPTKYPTQSPTKYPTNNPSITPTKTPSLSPTSFPSRNPSISPIKSPTINPSIPPTLYPSNPPTLKPSKTPTINPTQIPSETPNMSPTKLDMTCKSIIDWNFQWKRIQSWNENTMGETYKLAAEEEFINEYPQCGEYNTHTLQYYYYFKKKKKKLRIFMHVCCGKLRTFGCCYNLPNNYNAQYTPNQAIINVKAHKGGNYTHSDTTQKSSSTFHIKQYTMVGVLGLIIICCTCGMIRITQYYNKRKKGLSSTVNREQTELANVIQMHDLHYPLPRPQHVQLPSVTNINQATDGSTITSTVMRVKSFPSQSVIAKPNENIIDLV